MKWALAIVCALAGAARADKTQDAADAWIAALASGKPVAVSKDKPLAYWSEVPAAESCKDGKATTPDEVKPLAKCVHDLAARFSTAKDGFGAGTATTLAKATTGIDDARRKAIAAAAKSTKLFAYYASGDGESLTIVVAIAADRSVRALWSTAEAAE